MLIATLPPVHQFKNMAEMIFHPLVSAVRYNVGMISRGGKPIKILKIILDICEKAGKELFIDIKGRQLRIIESSVPRFAGISLNHRFRVDLPAVVHLRNEDYVCNLIAIRKNKIFLDPLPEIVCKGQAINVIGENLKIEGYLTKEDIKYLKAARELGITGIFASFVESEADWQEIWEIFPEAKLKLKIESRPGVALLDRIDSDHFNPDLGRRLTLVAARDDLAQNLGAGNPEIITVLESIINIDPDAILASCIFNSLKKNSLVDMADISDLRLMQLLGYKNFLLSDGISEYRFNEAMLNWKNYILSFPFEKGDGIV
jgi:hypothetical protein